MRLLGDDAVLARCKRVVFEKTKAKSKLGFEIDGPPRRKLVDFAKSQVVLKLLAPGEVGTTWKGYVNPVSEGTHAFESGGVSQSAPAHRAATAPQR